MARIIKIGADVHKNTYSLCAMEDIWGVGPVFLGEVQTAANAKQIAKFINQVKERLGGGPDNAFDFEVGYEAGCLGYSLYNQLKAKGIRCVILAPTTMKTEKGKRVKTDTRDARMIAECLVNHGYSSVYIPTVEDESAKEYIRMRDDLKDSQKRLKQQISAFCLRHGFIFDGTNWTQAHLNWLRELKFDTDILKETMTEYLLSYDEAEEKLKRYEARIEEIAGDARYKENVMKLRCFLGIRTRTALSLIVETGDFARFRTAREYSAYLGLVPGEASSGSSTNRLGITKMGNTHLRKQLIEASQGYGKGEIGYKSKDLKARQQGNTPETIAYADKANVRLRRRFYRYLDKGKERNKIVTATARELSCFIWGMMTGNTEIVSVR